jgi:RNA-directed DNA polymerase
MTPYIPIARPTIGPEDAPGHFYRQRQERRARRGELPGLEADAREIFSVEHLADVFEHMRRHNGEAPGPDGITYADIGRSEMFEILRPISRTILERRYRPGPPRPVDIPKSSGIGTRTLLLRNIADRVVSKALQVGLEPVWEDMFSDGSHGFRPGRSHLTLLAQLERTMIDEDRWVVVSDDVRGAFDHVRIDLLMELHRAYLDNQLATAPPLHTRAGRAVENSVGIMEHVIQVVLQGHDSQRTVGIDQGSPYSPTALNVYLHEHYDRQPHDPGGNPDPSTPRLRYADNLVSQCRDVREGEQFLHTVTQQLATVGLTLKGENGGAPVDLRRGKRIQLLGFTLSRQGNSVRYSLSQHSWEHLRQKLLEAYEKPHPAQAANAVIWGWIASHGPAFSYRQSRSVNYIRRLASSLGFRETPSQEVLEQACQRAWKQWQDVRRSAATQGRSADRMAG